LQTRDTVTDYHLTYLIAGQVRVLKHDNKKAKNRLSFSSEYVQKTKSVMALIFTRAADFAAGLCRAARSTANSLHFVERAD